MQVLVHGNDSPSKMYIHSISAALCTAMLLLHSLHASAFTSAYGMAQGTIPSPDLLRGCGGAQFASGNDDFEAQVLQMVNQIRLENGLLPMKLMDSLTDAARFHAVDMAEENYFSHTSHDRVNGELVESCVWSNRLRVYYTNWNLIGENIAAGYTTPQAAMEGWMKSDGHRKNILSPDNWEIGIGYFNGSGTYRHYWVQDFGRRHGVYPLVINSDAKSTDNGNLTLHIYGIWDELRLRVDQNEWSGWQRFVSPLPWQLTAGVGEHAIEIEMRNATENASARDTIYLSRSTAAPELNALPDALSFVYDLSHDNIAPGIHTIQPLASATDPAYTWQVSVDASWLSVNPGQGNSTETVSIVPSISGANSNGNDQATVTVSLHRADGGLVAEKKITVFLAVMEAAHALFAPVVSGQ